MEETFPSRSAAFEARSSVEYGCSMSVMSYISFAVITANTIININDVSLILWLALLCQLLRGTLDSDEILTCLVLYPWYCIMVLHILLSLISY